MALSEGGKPRTRLVHQLVLEAFDRPPREGEEGAHANADKKDNRIANLRWATKGGNMQDSARHGTAGVWMKGRTLLTAEQVNDIRQDRARGEKLLTIAERFGVDKRTISAIARGDIYKQPRLEWPLSNVHLGVSVESQQVIDRVRDLVETPAALRFLSVEPMLGPVDVSRHLGCATPGCATSGCVGEAGACGVGVSPIGWVISGGESGPGARPAHPAWFRSLRDQCAAADVPYFHKQNGEWSSDPAHLATGTQPCGRLRPDGVWDNTYGKPDGVYLRRVGKKAAGCLLDGAEHKAFPGACP